MAAGGSSDQSEWLRHWISKAPILTEDDVDEIFELVDLK